MTEWEPATDAEAAMREALRSGDQELYFRILSRTELLLPVSADALAGREPVGWGTWTTGGRTHVLAFTSDAALQACLAEHAGSARTVVYHELAATWPNLEWWLAVNPGLPVEGYLPAWFVAQLARGDVRLPGRAAPGRGTGPDQALPAGRALGPGPAPAAAPGPTNGAGGQPPAPAAPQSTVPPARLAGSMITPPPPEPVPAAARQRAAGRDERRTDAPGPPPGGQPPARQPSDAPYPSATPQPAAAASYPGSAPPYGSAPASPPAVDGDGQPDPAAVPGGSITGTRSGPLIAPPGDPSASSPGGPLPRRPVPGPSAQPESMAAAARSRTATAAAQAFPASPAPAFPAAPAEAFQAAPGRAEPATPPEPDGATHPSSPAGYGVAGGPVAPGSVAPGSVAPGSVAPAPAPHGPVGQGAGATAVHPPSPPVSARPAAAPYAPPGQGTVLPGVVVPGAVDSADAAGRPAARGDGGAQPSTPVDPTPGGFVPANDVEENLGAAARDGSTEAFLSTLLLARVLVPVTGPVDANGGASGQAFPWRTEDVDGQRFLVVFTSTERLAEHLPEPTETVTAKFVQLIRRWPDPTWSFAVNPGTPVGASLPGSQILALASWAAEMGLGDDQSAPVAEPRPVTGVVARTGTPPDAAQQPTVMQKAISAAHAEYYLHRGYDRVFGFVHRAEEVQHLRTPQALHAALGLGYLGSPFRRDAEEMYVLRWPAHRPSLYRIPYGGQNEPAMRAMEGWVIERAPFRGNGFAPGETSDVIAEFKVDSARLPHGAQLWRIRADGSEKLIAMFDSDGPLWRRVGDQ